MRDIRNYIEQLRLSNIGHSDYFTLSTYKNSQNKDMPCYLVTKKGCELIAHKLTGTKGTEFTAKYIDRFHKMENTIKQFVPQTREQLISMALIEANKVIIEQNQLIETQKQEIEEKTNQITEMKPKATYFDKVMQCKDLISITDIAKDYGWYGAKLNNFLHEQKVQFKKGKKWYLYQEYADKGYTGTKTMLISNTDTGEDHAKTHMYWTQKGRLFIYALMKKNGIVPIMERDNIAETA